MIMMLFGLFQCSPIQTTQRLRCEHTSYALGLTLPQSMHRIFFKTIGDTPANPKHAKKESLNNAPLHPSRCKTHANASSTDTELPLI